MLVSHKGHRNEGISDSMDSIASMTPMGAISNIGEAIAGKSETENSLSTIISNTSNTINAQENETSCNNTINEVDVNLIEIDGGECKTNYARGLVEMGVSPDKAAELSATLQTQYYRF